MALFPDVSTKTPNLTPEIIAGRLSNLYEQAHYLHLNTTRFSEHKALNKLYKGIIEYKDAIMELILGHIAPKRLGNVNIGTINPAKKHMQLVDEGIEFADDVYDWAEEQDWLQLCNLAAELQGLFATTKYILTLS